MLSAARKERLVKLAVSLEQLRSANSAMRGKVFRATAEVPREAPRFSDPVLRRHGDSANAFAVNPTTLRAQTRELGEASAWPAGVYAVGQPAVDHTRAVYPSLYKKLTGADKEAVNRTTWQHEAAEHAGRQPGVLRNNHGYGVHYSHKPPIQDLNIAATLPESLAPAADAIRAVRAHEVADMVTRHPDFAHLRLGEQRVSRHAIRRIQEASDAQRMRELAEKLHQSDATGARYVQVGENQPRVDYGWSRADAMDAVRSLARPGTPPGRVQQLQAQFTEALSGYRYKD